MSLFRFQWNQRWTVPHYRIKRRENGNFSIRIPKDKVQNDAREVQWMPVTFYQTSSPDHVDDNVQLIRIQNCALRVESIQALHSEINEEMVFPDENDSRKKRKAYIEKDGGKGI